MPNSDLSSLKIHDSARSKGAGGKVLRISSAALGVLVLVVGGVLLFRAQELFAEKVQSQEALDAARTNVDSLKAKILLARDQVTASEARVLEAQQGLIIASSARRLAASS